MHDREEPHVLTKQQARKGPCVPVALPLGSLAIADGIVGLLARFSGIRQSRPTRDGSFPCVSLCAGHLSVC